MKTRITTIMITIVVLLLLTTPAALAQIAWIKHTIDGNFESANSVYAEDVDGDGDMDVLGTAGGADDITWWENDGNQNFTEHTIDGSFNGAKSVHADDVDGDGDMDVLGAAYMADEIAWWNNDGDENFEKISLTTSCDGAYSVYAAPLDGNTSLDIVAASRTGDSISYWIQLMPGQFLPNPFTITTNFDGADEVYAADIDGDGDMDVLGAASDADQINWWENMGNNIFDEHSISGSFDGATSVHAEDVDGDGDMDVLGAAFGADDITWWENYDGGGLIFIEHTIDGNYSNAYKIYGEDVDGDGDMDVLGAAAMSNRITWWENNGVQNFTEHTIDGSFSWAASVYAEDVDSDGNMDVLGAANYGNDITWWEQIYPLSVSANSLDFGQMLVGSPLSLPLTIYGNDYQTVILTAVYADDSTFTTDFDPADSLLAPGDSLQIIVTFLPGVVAPYNSTLYIENSEKLVTVSLSGEGLMPVIISADTLGFEPVSLGFSDSLPLTIYNISIPTVVLSVIYSDEPAFTTDFDPADSLLAGGDSLQITVTFTPEEIVAYSGTLFIENNVMLVTVSLSGEGISPVAAVISPYSAPIVIPEAGGSFDFLIGAENLTPSPQPFDLWTEIFLPEYGSVSIMTVTGLNVPAYTLVSRDRSQTIPEYAPPGTYTYYAYIGEYPWVIDNVDSFTFEKEGSADGALGSPSDWFCSGESFDQWQTAPEMAIPTESALLDAYPNPFNPTTAIRFELRDVSFVELTVFDITGREVAKLVDGYKVKGLHEVTFEAEDLPSGIYFARLTAGEFQQTRKIILVK